MPLSLSPRSCQLLTHRMHPHTAHSTGRSLFSAALCFMYTRSDGG